MTVLVDSDVLIEVSRGRKQEIITKWVDLSNSGENVLCSPVSIAELWAGARVGEEKALQTLFRTLLCPAIDEATARQAGLYMLRFRKSHAVELADALIAACAITNGAHLWTENRKHYPMKELQFF